MFFMSDKRILQVADRVLTKGDKERALVLYMVVCNRMTVIWMTIRLQPAPLLMSSRVTSIFREATIPMRLIFMSRA